MWEHRFYIKRSWHSVKLLMTEIEKEGWELISSHRYVDTVGFPEQNEVYYDLFFKRPKEGDMAKIISSVITEELKKKLCSLCEMDLNE